jgi:hypothetical protein
LQEKERQLEEDLKNATGDAERLRIKTELEKTRTAYLAWRACGGGSTECVDYVNRLGASDYYESLDPSQRLHLWQIMKGGLMSGDIGKKDLQGMVRLAEQCKVVNRTMICGSQSGQKNAMLFVAPALVLGALVLVYAAGVGLVHSGSHTYLLPTLPELRIQIPWLNKTAADDDSALPPPPPSPGKIAGKQGHAREHAEKGDLSPWVRPGASDQEISDFLDDIINNPSDSFTKPDGREGYFDEDTGVVIIINPNKPESSTSFIPDNPAKWWDEWKRGIR